MKCQKVSFSRLKVAAIVKYNICGCGERSPVVKAPGCGPGDRGFKSHRSPHHILVGPTSVISKNPSSSFFDKISNLFVSAEIFFTKVVTMNHLI